MGAALKKILLSLPSKTVLRISMKDGERDVKRHDMTRVFIVEPICAKKLDIREIKKHRCK